MSSLIGGMATGGAGAAPSMAAAAQLSHSHSLYPPYYVPHPVATAEDARDLLGVARIRKVENGFVVEFRGRGAGWKEYIAADLKEAGERITALCVEKELSSETP